MQIYTQLKVDGTVIINEYCLLSFSSLRTVIDLKLIFFSFLIVQLDIIITMNSIAFLCTKYHQNKSAGFNITLGLAANSNILISYKWKRRDMISISSLFFVHLSQSDLCHCSFVFLLFAMLMVCYVVYCLFVLLFIWCWSFVL